MPSSKHHFLRKFMIRTKSLIAAVASYIQYLEENKKRSNLGLSPKPIDSESLINEVITQVLDLDSKHRKDALEFLIYNVLPGTTSAAYVKARFLKKIILGDLTVPEIDETYAFEQLSHMKGGPSVKILIDLLLGENKRIAKKAADVLKTQVFLYENDMERLEEAYNNGSEIVKDLIQSYANAEFFTKLPEIEEKIEVVTFVAGIGDISTDLLSPGSDAHSRSDRELHGQSIGTPLFILWKQAKLHIQNLSRNQTRSGKIF